MATVLPTGPPALGRRVHWLLVPLGLAALAWRLVLAQHYAGWEESDYGNLAMVRGVWEGGFRHYDMSHMPGYYALSALVLPLVEDTVIAARAVSMLGGVAALLMSVFWTHKHLGRQTAWIAGLLLVFQPEFALYASSSLREPLYAAFVVGCLVALSSEALVLAGFAAALAFLVRFDAVLALAPVLLVHALGRTGRVGRLVAVFGPLFLFILVWSAYCRWDHGTWVFWSHAVSVNVETGLGGEHTSIVGRLANGIEVAGTLVGWLLPWRLGWGVWCGLVLGLALVPWRRHGPLRTWSLAAVCLVAVWAGIGLVGQHDPAHNLYWKWLCPLVPVLVPVGVSVVLGAGRRAQATAPRALVSAAVVCVLLQGFGSNLRETQRQVALSDAWYRPQLDLARWIEDEVPEETPLLVDNIPACWLNRRVHPRRLVSWFDAPVPSGDEAAFSQWVSDEGFGWVLWFREEWTQAPSVAPFLADGGHWSGAHQRLIETKREDGYGWILYRVEAQKTP